jgi:hypothetical protein
MVGAFCQSETPQRFSKRRSDKRGASAIDGLQGTGLVQA